MTRGRHTGLDAKLRQLMGHLAGVRSDGKQDKSSTHLMGLPFVGQRATAVASALHRHRSRR